MLLVYCSVTITVNVRDDPSSPIVRTSYVYNIIHVVLVKDVPVAFKVLIFNLAYFS